MPTCCAAKQSTVVVPPSAADFVALSNVSELIRPEADNCSICACASTPPGITYLPDASISRFPAARSREIAAIAPPATATSARIVSLAVTTVPLGMTRSKDCIHLLSVATFPEPHAAKYMQAALTCLHCGIRDPEQTRLPLDPGSSF